jgi:hypothetical protein
MLTDEQLSQFETDGYVTIEEAVEPRLLEPLRAAAERVTERTRRGEWPHRRGAPEGDVWGVQNLLHPDLEEPVFAEYMATDAVLEVARGLLRDDVRLGLVNLLVNPSKADFEIEWHRDMIRRELPPEEEVRELNRFMDTVQWNTALYDDPCLLIVPASHNRASTPEERDAQFRRPMVPLPHQRVVELKAGQGVYYNNLLIHRGVYPSGRKRATLHAALARAETREYDIDLDYLSWMAEPSFREAVPGRLSPVYENWLKAYRKKSAARSD